MDISIQFWEEQMKEVQTERPPAIRAAATTSLTPNQKQDSTEVPPIEITKKTKRLIPEGQHKGLAVNGYHHWNNQYRRWEAVVEFVFEPPVPAGAPILMRVGMGNGSKPEIAEDHWFGRILQEFGTTDVAKLAGWHFVVTVKTVKKPHGEKRDLPEEEWYSTARRAVRWDDYVRASNEVKSSAHV